MGKGKRTKVSGVWTEEEIRLLKKLFRGRSTRDVANELGRTVGSVRAKASALGLRKTKKYLKSLGKA